MPPGVSSDQREAAQADRTSENPLLHKLAMSAAVGLPFLGCIAAVVLTWTVGWMGWLDLALLLGGWLLTGMGITIGFHRLLAHRSFETYRGIRFFWTTLGAFAVQGSPLMWCAVHRRHHERSDQQGDPHSPRLYGDGWWNLLKGFIHAHLGWLFTHRWHDTDNRRYVPDLLKDPLLVRVDRLYYIWVLLSLAIPAAIGGLVTMSWMGALLGLIWGGLIRIFVVHHATWSVNSLCHIFGRRDFQSSDQSRNNFLFGVLAHGEGWHNNHHAFPTSARHGLKWWQLDGSWMVIRAMQLCGLAWNVRLPSRTALAAKRLPAGRRAADQAAGTRSGRTG